MIYWDFKDLIRRTAADNVSGHKAFHIAKNPKYDGYQRRLASMIYNFFLKNNWGADLADMPLICELNEEWKI